MNQTAPKTAVRNRTICPLCRARKGEQCDPTVRYIKKGSNHIERVLKWKGLG